MGVISQLKAMKHLRFKNIDYNRFHLVFVTTRMAILHLENNTKSQLHTLLEGIPFLGVDRASPGSVVRITSCHLEMVVVWP